jgi:hypothetical protein
VIDLLVMMNGLAKAATDRNCTPVKYSHAAASIIATQSTSTSAKGQKPHIAQASSTAQRTTRKACNVGGFLLISWALVLPLQIRHQNRSSFVYTAPQADTPLTLKTDAGGHQSSAPKLRVAAADKSQGSAFLETPSRHHMAALQHHVNQGNEASYQQQLSPLLHHQHYQAWSMLHAFNESRQQPVTILHCSRVAGNAGSTCISQHNSNVVMLQPPGRLVLQLHPTRAYHCVQTQCIGIAKLLYSIVQSIKSVGGTYTLQKQCTNHHISGTAHTLHTLCAKQHSRSYIQSCCTQTCRHC